MTNHTDSATTLVLQHPRSLVTRNFYFVWLALVFYPCLLIFIFYNKGELISKTIEGSHVQLSDILELSASFLVSLLVLIGILLSIYSYQYIKLCRVHLDDSGIYYMTNMPDLLQGSLMPNLPADWSAFWEHISAIRLVPSTHFRRKNPRLAQVILEIHTEVNTYTIQPYQWFPLDTTTYLSSQGLRFLFFPGRTPLSKEVLLDCPLLKYLSRRNIRVHIHPVLYDE